MITADIKLDLTNGYNLEAYREKDGKVRIIIQLADVDVELWIKENQLLGDDIIQAIPEEVGI